MLTELMSTANAIRLERYPEARVIFLAGSLVRGEGTATSDLDIVVVFDRLVSAYRESYYFDHWPVEAFVHDPQTLEYFFREIDGRSGVPSLAAMVSEGVEVPNSCDLSQRLKSLAASVIEQGPPPWDEHQKRTSRYTITDLVADLKGAGSSQELYATAASLYSALADHYFRCKGMWSAKNKSIPRRLKASAPALAELFLSAFDDLFHDQNPQPVVQLAQSILAPEGGFLFEGHNVEAPISWRVKQ